MKKVFIISGNYNFPGKKHYRSIARDFESQGFEVVLIFPNWLEPKLDNLLEEVVLEYKQKKGDYNVIFGFSFGAMLGMKLTTRIEADHLITCSLSPYFSEHLDQLPFHWKLFNTFRWKHFKEHWSLLKILDRFSTPTTFIYGETEHRSILNQQKLLSEKLNDKGVVNESYIIEKTGHDLSKKKYREKIQDIIRLLTKIK